jgi:hypothetical protein
MSRVLCRMVQNSVRIYKNTTVICLVNVLKLTAWHNCLKEDSDGGRAGTVRLMVRVCVHGDFLITL